jgi:hypothetical protein
MEKFMRAKISGQLRKRQSGHSVRLTDDRQNEKLRRLLMVKTSDPNLLVAELAVIGLILAGLWRLVVWFRAAPVKPDPWSAEIEASLHQADATPICHRCLSPYRDDVWFCDTCGAAVGPYNNYMPYVHVFSEGEVFRNGVTDKMRASPLIIIGYLLFSLASYFVFAPIYWFFFFKNLARLKLEKVDESPEVVE